MNRRPLAIRLAAVACLCLSCATAVMLARFAATGFGTSWVAAGAVLSMAALLAGMTLSQGGRRKRLAAGRMAQARAHWGLPVAIVLAVALAVRTWAIWAALPSSAPVAVFSHWLALALALALAGLVLGAELERMTSAAEALEEHEGAEGDDEDDEDEHGGG